MESPSAIREDVILHLKYFLQANKVDDWTLLNFDKELIKKYPGISRKQAHIKVENDLAVLKKLYPERQAIQNQIKYIHKELKKHKKNDALNTLWEESKPKLDIIAIEEYTNQQMIASASLGLAANNLEQKAKKRTAAESLSNASSSKKRIPTRQTTSGSADDCSFEKDWKENDSVFVKRSGSSVGTIIKHKALLIHQKYQSRSASLSNRERKIMVAGLSSILDLTDQSMDSQRSLFTESEWKRLTDHFNKEYRVHPRPLCKFLDNTWTIVANICGTSVESGQKYIRKLNADPSVSKENRNILKLMEHCLDLIEDYPHLLVKATKTQKYTENDYFRIIWSRLFELLFASSTNVRIKGGESVPIFSTDNKAELYPDDKNVIGFKIDARVLVDVDDDEHDIISMELAKDDQDTKVINDSAKLVREAKDDLDNLLKLLSRYHSHKEIFSWSFQISGANCHISTNHTASDGLYVCTPQHSFSMPMSASTEALLDFRKTLELLLSVKDHATRLASRITKLHTKQNDISQNFGKFKQDMRNVDVDLWTRNTWYTPHRDDGRFSALPDHLFGLRRPKPLLEKLLLLADQQDDDNNDTKDKHHQAPIVDEYGYRKTAEGWYNIYTKETTDTHPLCQVESEDC